MCLAIPGKILEIDGNSALVDFDGVKQKVIIALIENPQVGRYIVNHAGYAIEQMDEEAALEAIEDFKEFAEINEIDTKDLI